MKWVDVRSLVDDSSALPRTTALIRENGLRALLLHLAPGEEIPEHQTRGAIAVYCLKGRVLFAAGADHIELTPGILISLAPGANHRLSSDQDSTLLVTISEQASPPSSSL